MSKTLVFVLGIVLLHSSTAFAWDPFRDDFDPGYGDPAPDPAPFAVPDGLYLVTDVYAGDVVTTAGATTTYATETVHDTPGTYARVIDVVGSGSGSAFDGASFNDRARLPDGRPVAGTYYEDFVLTEAGFASVNIVFFQDDSATRGAPPVTPAPTTPVQPGSAVPSATAAPAARPVPSDPRPPATTAPAATARPLPEPEPVRSVTATAGIALGPSAATLASIEILRGRTVHLWPRAFVDGSAVPIRAWRLVAGSADLLPRTSGGPGDACDATWLTPTSATGPVALRFEVTSDAVPGRVLVATLLVTVRSPALLR